MEIKDLVIKYLVNEASAEESEHVIKWIQASGENKNEFLELQALVDSILATTNPDKLKPGKAYQKLKDKIGKENVKNSGNSKQIAFYLKIAAIFLIGFGISWLLQSLIRKSSENPQQALYQKIEVPYGSKTRLELPDGTRVTLNSGSSLKYPVQFGDTVRNVYLVGEAYFDVKKDASKPFYVNTSGIHIKVLGTSFNVKSYPEEKTVETTLISGLVQIYSDRSIKNNEKPLLLKPSQKAVYIKTFGSYSIDETKIAQQVTKTKVDTFRIQNEVRPQLFTSWKDNRLEFDNESFRDLIVKLERWYNVEIQLNNDALNQARFSGKFDKENIEQALKALVEVTPFHYNIDKNKIQIYK